MYFNVTIQFRQSAAAYPPYSCRIGREWGLNNWKAVRMECKKDMY